MKITHKSIPVQKSGGDPLLLTQGRHRVPAGGTDGLQSDQKQGTQSDRQSPEQEDPSGDGGPVGKTAIMMKIIEVYM